MSDLPESARECSRCNGHGAIMGLPGDVDRCPVCNGDGIVAPVSPAVEEPVIEVGPAATARYIAGLEAEVERLRERMEDAYGCLVRMAPDERGMRNQAMALLSRESRAGSPSQEAK